MVKNMIFFYKTLIVYKLALCKSLLMRKCIDGFIWNHKSVYLYKSSKVELIHKNQPITDSRSKPSYNNRVVSLSFMQRYYACSLDVLWGSSSSQTHMVYSNQKLTNYVSEFRGQWQSTFSKLTVHFFHALQNSQLIHKSLLPNLTETFMPSEMVYVY